MTKNTKDQDRLMRRLRKAIYAFDAGDRVDALALNFAAICMVSKVDPVDKLRDAFADINKRLPSVGTVAEEDADAYVPLPDGGAIPVKVQDNE